ncbi:MAG: flagellar basal body L-ring protein FlgH [bacterium]
MQNAKCKMQNCGKNLKKSLPCLLSTVYCLLIAFPIFSESLWLESQEKSMFADRKASRIGDVVTVVIMESAKAQDSSSNKRGKSFELGLPKGEGPLDIIPKLGAKGESKYKKDGATSRTGGVSAKVSASVLKVMPNGNLLVEGEKRVKIDNEEQVIYVSGIVRPEDINPDNVILSTYLADAKIEYRGEIKVSSKEKPFIGVRIFQKLFGWIF